MSVVKNEYLCVGECGFVISEVMNDIDVFCYYSFDKCGIAWFNLEYETTNELFFKVLIINPLINNKHSYYLDALRMISEILYFFGGKAKNIIIRNCFQELESILFELGFVQGINCAEFIKDVDKFAIERNIKLNSIEELYDKPHLVPWNLVPCDFDIFNILNKYAKPFTNAKILEIGSGFGKNLSYMRKSGYNAIGIEFIKSAYEKSLQLPFVDNNVICGDITNTLFNEAYFDVIIDIGCLHCLPNEKRQIALSEVSKIIKKDGIIISRCFKPKDMKWLNAYPILSESFGVDKNEFLKLFTPYFRTIEFSESQKLDCNYFIGGCLV